MKAFLNDPADAVDEMLEGFCAAQSDYVRQVADRVVATANPADRVGVIAGGGSGHKPAFVGYVGRGMLDAVAVGDVFTSPPAGVIADAIRAADRGKGVLCLVGNYSGDVMNFEMAADLVELEGIEVRSVIATDDVGAGLRDEPHKRRGVAGQVLGWRICGALSDRGAGLDELADAARRINDATRTFGVALTPCTVPGASGPTFELGPDEMEVGVGHHGEPGLSREPVQPVDAIVDRLIEALLDELPQAPERGVIALINGLGATSGLEQYVAYRRVGQVLRGRGISIRRSFVGEFFTALNMSGLSVTLSALEDDLVGLLDEPVDTPGMKQVAR